MKSVTATLLTALLVGAAAISCMPGQRMAGTRIGGTAAPIPASWDAVDNHQEAMLRTHWILLPYVVRVGYVGVGSRLYVMGLADSRWLAQVRRNPDIELRVGDARYALRAIEVEDPAEIDALLTHYNEKYLLWLDRFFGSPLTTENQFQGLIPVRLDPRE